MKHPEGVNSVLHHLQTLAEERNIAKLHGGHLDHIRRETAPSIDAFMEHLNQKTHGESTVGIGHRGASLYTGGTFGSGGRFRVPNNPKEAYHYALNLTPHQLEMKREIAAQMLGAVPSPMWGKMVDNTDKLEADPEEYERIIDMPNTHSMARLIEAEAGHSKGGGFWKSVKHVARKAADFFSGSHKALEFINQYKDPILEMPFISNYKDSINGAIETANMIDRTVNPIAQATSAALKKDATEADRAKLKQLAQDSLEKAATTYLPSSKPYIESAKHVKAAYDNYQNAPSIKSAVENTTAAYKNVSNEVKKSKKVPIDGVY